MRSSVFCDKTIAPAAVGAWDWENKLENGYWTYSLDDVKQGLQGAFAALSHDFSEKFGEPLTTVGVMGVSAMMHGYLPFDKDNNLLTPFRTWRNTTTGAAAEELTALFGFNVPQRWSISHLYQAMLNREEHVPSVCSINTLAGYVHFMLTGERAVGVGEAAGIFPLDKDGAYDGAMLDKFAAKVKEKGYSFDIREVLPKIKFAGEKGAVLSEAGAMFLDLTGTFKAGVPLCPPEGDAGTGMVATNSVLPRTGNVSAGTSIFSMLVLEKPLGGVYPEIDVVATPDGKPVAMVHCNNCCSELDAWVRLFSEFAALSGKEISKGEVYELLYKNALNGDPDCGGTVAYNFLSGEPVAGVAEGRPMYFRTPDGSFNLANFIRAELYAAFGALKMGMDILAEKENVPADKFTGHGGLFKVQGVAQQFLADALNADVSVMKTAGEGGAWGMALLAAYMQCADGILPERLESCVFGGMERATRLPNPAGVSGFAEYIRRFKNGLAAQNAACC